MYQYSPKPYPGPITLFINEGLHRFDSDLGWKSIAQGGLKAYRVPGDHLTLLTVYGKEFAQVLRKCIGEVSPESADEPNRSRIDAA